MAMSSPSGRSSVRAEPNVTPMIDVMLVLLIIFMIIVPTLQSGFKATPPSGSNLKPHPEEEDEQVLGIDETGQYFLNGKPIQNSTLGPVLTNIYNARPDNKVLYVKADKNLKFSKVNDALQTAAESGVRKSAMVTDQTPGKLSAIESDHITPGSSTHTGGTP